MMAISGRERLSLRDRLARLILEEYVHCGDSYERMANRIADANASIGKRKVDRRKLKKIANRESVSLSADELDALNTYLLREGRGLAAIFGQTSIIKSLVEKSQMSFLLGSRPRHDTIELSNWDFHTMDTVMRSSYRATPTIRSGLEEVFLRSAKDNLSATTYAELFSEESWLSLLNDVDGPSLVCIGSPRACHATEVMLAKMLETTPFQRPDSAALKRLPFYFVWSQGQYDELSSAFAARETVLPKNAPRNTNSNAHILALHCNGEFHYAYPTTEKWSTYGVIAAQRRRTGQVWLVITGLNGPGTLATARVVDSITTAIPQAEAGKHGPVLWAIAEGDIDVIQTRPGDRRELTNQRLLPHPSVWHGAAT